ncbi:glycoside hydrolase family 3 protein [Legionella londiniensis]|nr:glycoside hydrolase family 3 N-terminal domain-containing protein [Legionella londiniensis]
MMQLRRKIAQMLIMGFKGCSVDEQSPVASWLEKDGLGGVILFDKDLHTNKPCKNLANNTQIKNITRQLQDLSKLADKSSNSQPLPLLIALDYEGGYVDRLAHIPGCIKTLSPAEQALLSPEAFFLHAEKMALQMKSLGFNLNFAPVVDLNLNDEQGIIGKLGRSFADNAEDVVRVAREFVRAFSKHGIICTLKHFPGHGSAIGDTHLGFVDVTHSYQPSELLPYEMLLNEHSSLMVMTAHVINRHLDPQGLPATLSYPIITETLRKKIGFEGVVVSDDLQMHAISDHYSLDESLEKTINAGSDMLIFANQLGAITATEVIDAIENLVERGAISIKRIEEAYERIVLLKRRLN